MADILGDPMIVHVWRRAFESGVGEVVVATDHLDIKRAIEQVGGRAVMTRVDHESGSDRIFEALQLVDPDGRYETIVNLQGDLPSLEANLVEACLAPLAEPSVDIATLGVMIDDEEERTNPNVVKIIGTPVQKSLLRALYFTRASAPYGDGPLYHHIGLYAYRRKALERFVTLAPSVLERREKLEQLRALENEMRIDVAIVDTIPLGVDTHADLEKARRLLSSANG